MYFAIAVSVSKLAEVANLLQQKRRGGNGLSQLSLSFLYGSSLYAGLLIFLTTNNYPQLTVIAGAAAHSWPSLCTRR